MCSTIFFVARDVLDHRFCRKRCARPSAEQKALLTRDFRGSVNKLNSGDGAQRMSSGKNRYKYPPSPGVKCIYGFCTFFQKDYFCTLPLLTTSSKGPSFITLFCKFIPSQAFRAKQSEPQGRSLFSARTKQTKTRNRQKQRLSSG